MIIRKESYPKDLNTKAEIKDLPDMVCRGGSCIIDPFGHYVTDPVWDEETIIYAELDMDLPASSKMEHDAVGHYARPDVLQLVVFER
jgi:nitrilase